MRAAPRRSLIQKKLADMQRPYFEKLTPTTGG